MLGIWIEVTESDSIESLAFRSGHLPETIWNHAENGELNEKRESMHVLAAGDRVFIPELQPKEVSAQTGRLHRFRRRAVPSRVILTIVLTGKPLAATSCRMEFPGWPTAEVTTDSEGRLEMPIDPAIPGGKLTFALASGEMIEIPLAPRRLDPVTTMSGFQARLRNLGYYHGDIDDENDMRLGVAIASFLRDRRLPFTLGEQDLKAALLEAHGG